MSTVPTRTLPSGDELPLVGFGTYDIDPGTTTKAVRTALEAGYRHVDCAEGYGNEREVGEALAEYDREELFVTSKVVPKHLHYESLISASHDSLDRLGTDYLDLYLIHWPNPAISLRETLSAMAHLVDEGLVRNIGVSNFTAYQLRFARQIADVPIATNQAELHPWFKQPELREYAAETDLQLTAAAPLARTKVFDDPVVQDLAEKYGKSPAQIVIRWQIQNGIATIPRSTTPAHIQSNLAVTDWELTAEDVDRIKTIDRRERQYMVDPTHPRYGISK
ncbi:diketogulonate reductase-like aldo/keto reductase [Halohasta litchfieldiae]|uniref:Aldo/keto reductase n=1 Tax=Halohasta litchfieldiae TaxID=1073996 RepID=A0A1H6VC45_9EURY|nr:aldo/keto reductase [Halohasta litchfieldiae]ATW87611.1 diketogulonate reductase-like aldo/keto reductase [Halohasta litchfieldiae]SEI97852.1 Aldo/keto reductase [Halohasta litchfieldiae]